MNTNKRKRTGIGSAVNTTPPKEQGKHTPGAWDYKADSKNMRFIIHHEGREIAYLPSCMDGEFGKYETTANINMIISAPELLKALQGLVNSCSRVRRSHEGIEVSCKNAESIISALNQTK